MITLASILFDEVALMPQSFVSQATARCSVTGSKIFFNCNPEGPYHWFKTEYIDKLEEKNAFRLHFMMDDNLSLSNDIKERYKRMYTGLFYKRYILGEWALSNGIIYDMYNEEYHLVKTQFRLYEKFYVSIDYGTQNATVFLLWGLYKNIWYIVKEYYYSGRNQSLQKTDKQYSDDLKTFLGNINPIAITVDPSAASFIAQLRKDGFKQIRQAMNNVIDGIRTVSTALSLGVFKINDCCVETRKEFASYIWDEKKALKGEEAPVKEFDHCLTGDTLIDTINGQIPIKDLVNKKGNVYCFDEKNKIPTISYFYDVRKTQSNIDVFEIETDDGRIIKATEYHPILTQRGWVKVKDLKKNDNIIDIKNYIGHNKIYR